MLAKQTRILVNHIGFTPSGAKSFVTTDPPEENFQIIRRWDEEVVFTGRLKRVSEDIGTGWVGSFSEIRKEGTYFICCGELKSRVVTVYSKVYEYPLRVLFNYFPTQRCGDSITGWHAPCHTNDAKCVDTDEHIDVSGGWHQSCDLRKWCVGTSWGLLGLAQFGLQKSPRWDRGQVVDELRWGNQYFHKMVRPDGGLMDHVVLPLGWVKERNVYPNNAPTVAAYTAIIGQAIAARLFQDIDPNYGQKCLNVGQRMWRYITGPHYPTTSYEPPVIPKYHEWMPGFYSQNYPGSALDLGDALYTAIAMYRATKENEWLDTACLKASVLVDLQVGGDVLKDPVAACFRVGPGRLDLACNWCDGFFGPMGLCEILKLRTAHKDAEKWRNAIYLIAEQKCMMAKRNPWRLIPSYWYIKDPGNGRRAGSGYYKYFYEHNGLRIGSNFDTLGNALFLLKAQEIIGDKHYLDIAYSQLNWVLGCNSFDASTVEAIGRNQPERLINTDEFFPPTPQIPGAVMTGICGTENDEPVELKRNINGGFNDSEYDMPPTAMLMWLMSELGV